MVDPSRVVEEEPVHEEKVETINVVGEEKVLVIHKAFLDRTIKPFDVGIHLGSLWIGVVVGNLELQETICKVLLELTAVVGEDKGGGVWKHLYPSLEELLSCL